jgi:ADP-heptose:LPS heptosyltransferase
MTLPALGFLKKHTGAPVGVVVSPQTAELALRHSWIDEVFTLDRNRDSRHLRKVARAIRRKKYQTAFIFDGQLRSLLTATLAGIKNRLGAPGLYPLGVLSLLYSHEINIVDNLWSLESQAFRAQKMAAAVLGLEPGAPMRPPPPDLDQVSARRSPGLLAELAGQGPIIGLALQGRQLEKSWPLAHFAALCRKLSREFGAAIFVVGTEEESPLARNLARAAGVPVANFCGRTSLSDVILLAAGSDLFITVDTGTSHLVALTDTPLISVFIWTSPALWPPQTPHARLMVYDWALSRFALKPTDGPWLRPWINAPVITPDLVFKEALVMLKAASTEAGGRTF